MSQDTLIPPPHDEAAIDAMAVMDQIREEFRRRRGQAPVARNDFHRHMDGIHLKQLQHLGDLAGVPIPFSHRKKVGKAIMIVRRVLWKLLAPITRQQTDVNKALTTLAASLLQDRDLLFKENQELRRRLEALEATIAQQRGSV